MVGEREGGGYLQKAGRYLAAGAAALAIAIPGEEAEAASVDYDPCDTEAAVEVDSPYERYTWFTRDREYLVDAIEAKLARVEGCARSDWEGELYEEGFDPEKAKDISTTGLNQINALLGGLQDEGTLEEIGRLVRDDLRDGEVTVQGVKATFMSSEEMGRGIGAESVVEERPDGYVVEGTFTVESDETEWGGLVDWWNGDVEFEVYEPGDELGDGMYMPSEALLAQANDTMKVDKIELSADGYARRIAEDMSYPVEDDILRFHTHALHRAGDGEFAGPSIPDLQSVGGNGAGVVVTALGVDEDDEIVVNLDWYTDGFSPLEVLLDGGSEASGGKVVDLGVYSTGVEMPLEMRNCRSKVMGRRTVPELDMAPDEDIDLDTLIERVETGQG